MCEQHLDLRTFTPRRHVGLGLGDIARNVGERAAGRPNDQLVGGIRPLAPDQVPVKTVGSYWPYATTLLDYIRRASCLGWRACHLRSAKAVAGLRTSATASHMGMIRNPKLN